MSKRWDRSRYPEDWDEISRHAKDRAGWRCVGSPLFPDCRAAHGMPHPETGLIVVLTTGHRDHDSSNNADENLAVWCQRCHLAYDAHEHSRRLRRRLWEARCVNQVNLFAEA